MADQPTMDDVRAIFRRHIEDMEKWQAQDIAAGHTTSSWEEGLSIYRLALAALDDAERVNARAIRLGDTLYMDVDLRAAIDAARREGA